MLDIPNVTQVDVTFGNIEHLPQYSTLPKDFQRHNGNAYVEAISHWFFVAPPKFIENGIEINGKRFVAKPGVEANKALAAIKSILVSYAPKHEHKEGGCAFLLAEWFDIQ